MLQNTRSIFAVTGAQGVGKSTFCRSLLKRLQEEGQQEITLLEGLGARIQALGVPLGSTSTGHTIAAVFTAHLEREASAPGGIIILDRCIVDALAYSRALRVSSDVELRLYEQVASLAAGRLKLVIHLRLSRSFADKGRPHETPQLRSEVAENIPTILRELELPHLDLDASAGDAVEQAASAILKKANDN